MKAVAVLALAAAATIWWLRQQEPPAPPPAPPAARKPVAAPKPPPLPPKARPRAVAAKPRPAPAPLVLKQVPPPEKQPPAAAPPQPVALSQPEPPAPRPEPQGDSVFSWGPWSQTSSAGAGQSAPALAGTPAHNVTHVLPATQVSAGATPPALPPSPGDSGNLRPGHGWGDRNHVHVHRRGRD